MNPTCGSGQLHPPRLHHIRRDGSQGPMLLRTTRGTDLIKEASAKEPRCNLDEVSPLVLPAQVQRSRLLRHISEEPEAVNSGGEEEMEVELRTPSTPRSPAIDIDNVFQQKQREIAEDTDEMSRLRDLATRLQLTTRRPSYLDWAAVLKERGRRVGEALAAHTPTVVETSGAEQEGGQEVAEEQLGEEEEELSMDRRKHNLQTAVDWVKKELTEMRQQDQQLARQLMQLRVEVQRLRLLNSCLATSCLLEEVASGAEEAKMMEASDLFDLPPDLRETFSPVLREMGLTRMNITSRRFSLR
ncbi:protein FAM167A-like isoform X2 [Eriocheir sinensis]|uniref:protein FAM167A-like isoform X2 n=1 Tax=Eriocheir sinensis TaxID=95602 RepID=UPI0021C90892|nr:protein FAM167A-like isoform X2 [Eriocheir sinensis]